MNGERFAGYAWQLIHLPAQSPALHMALDEVLTDEVAAGRQRWRQHVAAGHKPVNHAQPEA